jgi:DNA polymerase IV
MDAINERVGPNSVYFASMHEAREQAPMRIAFTHIPDITAESEGKR